MLNVRTENSYFIFGRPKTITIKYYIRKLLYIIASLRYKFLLSLAKKKQDNKKYNVAICAIFKNEAPYLREWIEFNHVVGVEHFYMYNNNSEDNYLDILQPYIDNGLVTLTQWPQNQKQMECYCDCIANYSYDTKWLGFIDIDEFIIPKSTHNLYDFLKNFEDYGAVNIYWRMFGSSGIIDRNTDGLVVEDFTVCWPKLTDIGKCFYNTAFDFNEEYKNGLHHSFGVDYHGIRIPPVNCFGKFTFWGFDPVESNEFPIQINHYFTKAVSEYVVKKNRGDVYFVNNPHDDAYFYLHEMKCTSVDYSAYKYLIKLKILMGDKH